MTRPASSSVKPEKSGSETISRPILSVTGRGRREFPKGRLKVVGRVENSSLDPPRPQRGPEGFAAAVEDADGVAEGGLTQGIAGQAEKPGDTGQGRVIAVGDPAARGDPIVRLAQLDQADGGVEIVQMGPEAGPQDEIDGAFLAKGPVAGIDGQPQPP